MNSENIPVITIDGPSGSGKGTISALLAQHLHWKLLDSGALYRVLGFAVEQAQAWEKPPQSWAEIAHTMPISFKSKQGQVQAYLGDQNIEAQIRNEQAGARASIVAAEAVVRVALLDKQRAFLQAPGLVADGRDMGTVVFPKADLKIFLTASAKARAERRYLQLKAANESVNLAALLEEIQQRDERDMNRSVSPLVPAEDAIQLDSTNLSIEKVFEQVLDTCRDRHLVTS